MSKHEVKSVEQDNLEVTKDTLSKEEVKDDPNNDNLEKQEKHNKMESKSQIISENMYQIDMLSSDDEKIPQTKPLLEDDNSNECLIEIGKHPMGL